MLLPIIEELKHYDEVFAEASAELSNEKGKLAQIYNTTGDTYKRLSEEKDKEFYAKTSVAKERAIGVTNGIIDSAVSTVSDYVLEPVPDGFINTLETLKVSCTLLSDEECNLYLQKYGANYAARKSLLQLFNANDHKRREIYSDDSFDDIKKVLEDLRTSVINWIQNTADQALWTYSHQVMIADGNNPITVANEQLLSFLSGQPTK